MWCSFLLQEDDDVDPLDAFMADVSKQVNLSVGTHLYTLVGVANGKCEPL